MIRRILAIGAAAGLLVTTSGSVAARSQNAENAYTVTALVSDVDGAAIHTDSHLVNGWGITAGATTPWWVANNGTDTSTLYDGAGVARSLVVSVPGHPTGAVTNTTTDFVVSAGGGSGAARFIFATESGTIVGWNPGVPPPPTSTQGQVAATSPDGAIYKGLAIGRAGGNNYLYATDFHNGRVDVWSGDWSLQSWPGAFVDPGLPAGFAPFGIANLNGTLFVTYAKQDADREDEIAGAGLGYVSAFGTDGTFLGRVASGGDLDAPWGLAWAPAGFDRFSGDLLVGNFGDGRIHGYALTPDGWEARGPLKGTDHRPIVIDGLWGIGFGNGSASGPTTTLYFAAGPDDESHGLFGSIAP
jgi:uncharacterized protein (TIGR03118 family)